MKFYLSATAVFLFLIISAASFGQERLIIAEALRIALEKNYDVRLVSNELEISKNNVSRGPMLPVITGNLSKSTSISNTKQTQSNGEVVNRSGAQNSSLNYGPSLNWTVFDGFGMFAAYDRLKELQKYGEANLKSTILGTVFNVITTYYDIARQQQQVEAAKTAVGISRFRVTNAQNRYQIGRAAKLEVLAATVDLNTDTTTLLRQQDLLRSAKILLNELLTRDVNTDFAVTEVIDIESGLQQNELLALAINQNPSLQLAVINRRIAELNLKQVRANRYPVVGVTTGYNFGKTESELGFARQSTGRGFSYGFNASIPIFAGFQQRRNEKNAAIEIDNAAITYEKLNLNVRSRFASAYQTYLTSLALVQLEQQNRDVAKQNLDITLEKFRLGSIAPLEFREAQRNYVDANVRFTNAQYEAKLAEISLKEISGTINLK